MRDPIPGQGGDAHAEGKNALAVGGKGGAAPEPGAPLGGGGGSGYAKGDNAAAFGGNAGDPGRWDGSGGKGGDVPNIVEILRSRATPQVTVNNSPGSIVAPSGGTNSITNNFVAQRPDPHLDDAAKAELQSRLKRDGSPVLVMGSNGNTKSMRFAAEVYDFLKSAGYPMFTDSATWQMFSLPANMINVEHANNGTQWWVSIGPVE